MRKEKKAATVSEALHRLLGELLLSDRKEQAEKLTTAMRALSIEELARLHDILNGASALS